MKKDLYVKVCLTVIAVSLSTIALKDIIAPQAHAADLNSIENLIKDVFRYLIDELYTIKEMCRSS